MADPVEGTDPRREIILDAADRLYQRYGYRKTTVEDIAEEAGICRGTIYLHFASKEAIALAWADRGSRVRCAHIAEAAAAAEPASVRLRRMLAVRVMLSFDWAQPYAQSIDELFAALRPALLARREVNHGREVQIVAGVLADGVRQGEFDIPDPDGAARLIVLITNALLPYSLSARQLGNRECIEGRIYAVVDLLLNGLRTRK